MKPEDDDEVQVWNLRVGRWSFSGEKCFVKARFSLQGCDNMQVTPRKTNMSHENQWLEDVCPIEIIPF